MNAENAARAAVRHNLRLAARLAGPEVEAALNAAEDFWDEKFQVVGVCLVQGDRECVDLLADVEEVCEAEDRLKSELTPETAGAYMRANDRYWRRYQVFLETRWDNQRKAREARPGG